MLVLFSDEMSKRIFQSTKKLDGLKDARNLDDIIFRQTKHLFHPPFNQSMKMPCNCPIWCQILSPYNRTT